MDGGLRIKEVADASGFTAATLRYYEQIGLLPEAARTPAGYRMYDQRTLPRLAFIAHAKQLGCTLEEITGLTTAWDGGQCGPIQDQLRGLVAGKIAAAQAQIVELLTFTSELQQAAVALSVIGLRAPVTRSAVASANPVKRRLQRRGVRRSA